MIGAICGDFIGSVYEFDNIKTKDFELFSPKSRFTDDTVMTIATMDALLHGLDFGAAYKNWYRKYPEAGYGSSFAVWAAGNEEEPYNSWGNGSAMRVSPVGIFSKTLAEAMEAANQSARVTHNHPEGIKGAQAVATAVFLANSSKTKEETKQHITAYFGYDLSQKVDDIRAGYRFDVSCQGSVPQAIMCFLQSEGYEDALRTAISLGGDSDTIACIAGGIAEAFYGAVPVEIKERVLSSLPVEFQQIIEKFYKAVKDSKKKALR